ncbi:MAG: hybrid sensor histidine kinase/response regulator [Phenylobacterium zucineum]|nr:MAG: hybrid sensor histidine kinase/response regulator [Phenylobacterium zucineum]
MDEVGGEAEPDAEPRRLVGGGSTGDLIRAHDWVAAGLGAIASWPAELFTSVQTVLSSRVPMVVLWGEDGRLIYNDGYAEVCGPRHPQALGGRLLEIWPEARDFNQEVLTRGMAGEALHFPAQELELWRHGRPEQVWMDLEYTPIRGPSGRPTGVLAMVFDITQRVLAERRLAESAELFRFLDQLGQAASSHDTARRVLSVTTRMVGEHLGVSNCAYADMDDDGDGFTIRGDWHAAGSPSIVGHYSLADFGALAVEALNAGQPLVINDNRKELAPHEAQTFQDIGVAATICMPLVKAGRLRALMAIHDRVPRVWSDRELTFIRAVTERSWAHVERVGVEAALRHQEEQLRLATDAAEIGLWDVDVVNDTLYWPPRLKAMFGISPDRPVTLDDFYAGLHPDDLEATSQAYAAAADPDVRGLYDVEYRTVGREDGVIRWVAAKGRGVFEDDRCLRVIGTAIDITHRKARDQALQDLNETLERRIAEGLAERRLLLDLVESMDAIIIVLGRDYEVLAINRAGVTAFEQVYGARLKVGDSMLALLGDRPRDIAEIRAWWDRALSGEEFTDIGAFGSLSRERRWFEMTFRNYRDDAGQLVGAYQFVYDVSDRIREQERLAEAEEQLRQSQKIEQLGRLTGGVAHDFNNLLTPIIGSLDLLSRNQVGTPREKRLIDGALQSAERARILVQRLLAFARRQPLQPTAVDVATLVAGMADLIGSSTGPQVQVITEIGADLPLAHGDQNQLEMALLNLSVNARDAMPAGGRLTITADLTGDEHPPQGLPSVPHVRISVADTGTGMDEATLARAIEPFFSTKGIGKGTGLGLSMVHGLAQQLGGALRISSVPAAGTTVELWLPVSVRNLSAPAGVEAVPARLDPLRGTVLLVDDEEVVRASTAHMLEDLGFKVVEVGSAEAALAILRERSDIALLVTDHLMAGMDGAQLVRIVRRERPGLPSLIVSGYAEAEGIDPDLPRLTKPFRALELLEALAGLDR